MAQNAADLKPTGCHFAKLKGTEKGGERDGKGTVKGRGGDLGKLRGEGRGHFFITFWSFLRHFYVTSKPRDRGKKEHSGRFRGPAGLQERACATLRPGGRRMGPCGSFRVGNGCRAAAGRGDERVAGQGVAVGGARVGGRLCVHDARPRLSRRRLHMVRGGEASGPRARHATYRSARVCPRTRRRR